MKRRCSACAHFLRNRSAHGDAPKFFGRCAAKVDNGITHGNQRGCPQWEYRDTRKPMLEEVGL